ncbi:phospholipase domain protein, partial [mine drainage metagenome]
MSARALGVAMPQAGAAASIAPERAPVLSVFDYPAPLLTPGPRISLHAKSFVIDGRIAVIGSHNFDPRSDHYNTENGVVIDDTALAQALRASILRATRPDN